MRVATHSSLDAIADSPSARYLGVTARLHRVCERYEAMVRESGHPLDKVDVQRITQALVKADVTLAPPTHPDSVTLFLATIMPYLPDCTGSLCQRIRALKVRELVCLLEDIDEKIAVEARGR